MGAGLLAGLGGALSNIGSQLWTKAGKDEEAQRLELSKANDREADFLMKLRASKEAINQAWEQKKVERDYVRTGAQAEADKRGGALADQAMSRVKDVPDEAGRGLLADGILKAKADGAFKQEVSARDLAMASDDYKSVASLDQTASENARHASERGEDVDYRNKKLKADLAQHALANVERQEKMADKRAVKELFDELAFAIDSAHTNGDSTKYQPQIDRAIIGLRKYGIDASDMIYGKAKKTGETDIEEQTPSGTQKVKKDTYGREGGVLNTSKPGVGGKPLDIKPGVNGEYVTKDGKRFFVPYKQ